MGDAFRRNLTARDLFGVGMVGVCAAAAYFFFASGPSSEVATAPLRPEQIVEVTGSDFVGCLSRDELGEFIGHAVAGEKTKALAMTPVPCMKLPTGEHYRLLSVQRTVAEFTHESNHDATGMWAAVETFRAVRTK